MKLTVYFDGQFWVGVIEQQTIRGFSALRHVFGSEPRDEELLHFIHHDLSRRLDALTAAVSWKERDVSRSNPKRIARLAAQEMRNVPVSTKAQEAIQAQREAQKQARNTQSKAEKEAEAERRFQLSHEKAKKRHRGK